MIKIKDSLGIDTRPLEQNRDKGSAGSAKAKPGSVDAATSQDKVVLSDRSREAMKASEALAATPATRQEKIDELKNAIANNTYHVTSEQVADRIIVDFLKGV